jgi:hypothetical protein
MDKESEEPFLHINELPDDVSKHTKCFQGLGFSQNDLCLPFTDVISKIQQHTVGKNATPITDLRYVHYSNHSFMKISDKFISQLSTIQNFRSKAAFSLNKIFTSNLRLLNGLQIRDDSAPSVAIIARMKELHPTITNGMLTNLVQTFKNITYKKTVTFYSLGQDMIKFVIDFGLLITHGTYPSIVQGLDFRRNWGELDDEVVVHIKQAMQEDLIKILHPVSILNVTGIIRHEHPNLLDDLTVYFTTENKADKSTFKAAHYFVKIEDYHRFVFGFYNFDQEQPTTDQFKAVHPILLLYVIISYTPH